MQNTKEDEPTEHRERDGVGVYLKPQNRTIKPQKFPRKLKKA